MKGKKGLETYTGAFNTFTFRWQEARCLGLESWVGNRDGEMLMHGMIGSRGPEVPETVF